MYIGTLYGTDAINDANKFFASSYPSYCLGRRRGGCSLGTYFHPEVVVCAELCRPIYTPSRSSTLWKKKKKKRRKTFLK